MATSVPERGWMMMMTSEAIASVDVCTKKKGEINEGMAVSMSTW